MLVRLPMMLVVLDCRVLVVVGLVPMQRLLHLRIIEVMTIDIVVLHAARDNPVFDFGDLSE